MHLPMSHARSLRFTTFWESLISFRVLLLQEAGPMVAEFKVRVLVAIVYINLLILSIYNVNRLYNLKSIT